MILYRKYLIIFTAVLNVGFIAACLYLYEFNKNINNEAKIAELESQIEDLNEKYEFEKKEAEYWYYYNVDDAC